MKLEDNSAKKLSGGVSIIFNVIGIIFAICLIGSVIRLAFGFDNLTFTSLLEYISNAPSVKIEFYLMSEITADWGVFNFLRNLYNSFAYFWSFIAWFGINAYNGLMYIFYFVRILFV